MKKNIWSYLIARRKEHLDTSAICIAASVEGIEMYNTCTPEALNILKQLQLDLKAHYRDHKTKRDEYLLKANLAQDAGEEDKANTIRNIKKAESRNQCYRNFRYNRILMSVASLSDRKYGVHRKVVYVHALTLKEAKYKLKLSSKTSNTSYRNCKKFPIHGTGKAEATH